MVAPFKDGRVARSMVRVPGSGTNDEAGPICLNLGIVSNLAAMVPVPPALIVSGRKGRQQLQFSGSLAAAPSKLAEQGPQGVLLGEEKPQENSANVPNEGFVNNSLVMLATSRAISSISSSSMTSSGHARGTTSAALKRPRSVGAFQEQESHPVPKKPRVVPFTPSVESNNGKVFSRGQVSRAGSSGTGNAQLPFAVLPMPIGIPIGLGFQQQVNTNAVGNASPTIKAGSTSSVPISQGGITVNGSFVMVPLQELFQLLPEGSRKGMQLIMADRNRLKKENEALKYRLARFHQLMRNKEKLLTVLQNMKEVAA